MWDGGDGYSNKQPFFDASGRAGAASSGPRMASPEVQDQKVTDKLVSLVLREAAMSAAQRSFQKTRVQDECE